MEPEDLVYSLLNLIMVDIDVLDNLVGTFDDNIGSIAPDDRSRANADLRKKSLYIIGCDICMERTCLALCGHGSEESAGK